MNILDKQSPSQAATNSNAPACPPSSSSSSGSQSQAGSITPSSSDCLMASSQLMSLTGGPPCSTAPSSVSSSSAPHTPIDTLNSVTCTPDLASNGLSNRPNVSTPSSVFNSSAPNTPMPCPSVGSEANITSPALGHQLDQQQYGDQKLFTSNSVPPPPPPPPQPANNSVNNAVLPPSPLSQPPPPPPICNESKSKSSINNGNSGNKKHCANRNQSGFASNNDRSIKCENGASTTTITKNQMNFSGPGNMPNMSCMSNGSQLNGNVSPFDVDVKMGGFSNEFSNPMQNESIPPMANIPMQRQPNYSPMGMQSNMINRNDQNKLCTSMPSGGMMKPPPMDAQYMQLHSQIFVFNTQLANHAALAVDSGQCPTIIDFHLSYPGTKSFLEKNCLKIQNINKPMHMWSRSTRLRGPSPNGMCGGGGGGMRGSNFGNSCFPTYNHNPPGPGPGGGMQWNGPNGSWPNQSAGYPPGDMKMNNCNIRPYGPQYSNFDNNFQYNAGGDMQDPNLPHLTPQKMQEREKKLALLANLQQKFLPELADSGRPTVGGSQPPNNEFPILDSMTPGNANPNMIPESEQLNAMIPSSNYNPSFSNMNNLPGSEQWPPPKSSQFVEEKHFTGRRKGSQASNQANLAQQSVNSPNACIASSPGNRVPPPPYTQGLRSITSPHPTSPATLPSPSTRQPAYGSGGMRSGPNTPSADQANCALINSPKSTSTKHSNASPGNKKTKGQTSIENDLSLMNSFPSKSEPALMPVPSPKQIDYINNFEGQELTIHKQANAHFQDNDLLSSNDINSDMFPSDFGNMCPPVNNPPATGMDMNQNQRFPLNSCNFEPSHRFSVSDANGRFNNGFNSMDGGFRQGNMCMGQFGQSDGNMRFPHCDSSMKGRLTSPGEMPFNAANQMADFNNSVPAMNPDGVPFANGQSRHNYNDHPDSSMSSSLHLQNLQKMTPPFEMANKDGIMPNSKQMPNMAGPPGGAGAMHPNISQNSNARGQIFDQPFSSMPSCNEMNEAGGVNFTAGNNMHHSGMSGMGYANNYANSPRMPADSPQYGMSPNSFNMPINGPPGSTNGGPQMMNPGPAGNMRFANRGINSNTQGPRYNSPNIQVKPDAPNTIQYLPSRPPGPTSTPPNRPPPNLDFLQQSLNKSSNGPYMGGGTMMMPRPGQNHFGPRGSMVRPQNGPMTSQGPPPMGGPPSDMYPRAMVPGNLPMGGNCPPPPPNSFCPSGGGPGVPGPNQPLTGMHLDGSQSYSFTNSNDPAYQDKYHSFQQELYATNTRNSNANNPRMSSNF